MMPFQTDILAAPFLLIPFLIKMVIVTAITTALSMLLARRQKGPSTKPAGINEFQYPTAIEGRPLLVVWGKRRVLSCNAITPVFDLGVRRKRKDGQTVAYYYDIGLHIQVCHAADGIPQLWMGGYIVWPNPWSYTQEAADATAGGTIAAGSVFGGWEREGGVSGPFSIQYGGAAQLRNAYLEAKLGAGIPAYRGFVGIVLEHDYIGTSPYIKPITALVKRTNIFCDSARSAMWYIAKANIGDDHMNAIHIIYELITSTTIGAGKSTSLIGDSFATAADSCYTDGYGLDVVWDSAPDDVQTMIDKICEVIDGLVYQDLSTGKFEVALARADYNPATLDTYDESYFWVEDYEVPSPAKTPSKTIIHWHDRKSTKKRPAYDDDIAMIELQGASPVVQEYDFSGFVASEELANKIAAREQNKSSAMPKFLTLRCDRRMADLHLNSVFKLSYADLSITTMIVRVVSAEYGSLADGEVVLHVMEDVFGTAYTVYGSPPLEEDFEGVTDPQTDIISYGDTGSGKATWDDGHIVYEGRVYAIAGDVDGTTDQYVWFDSEVSETELQHGAVAPTAETAYLLWENTGGTIVETYGMTAEDTISQSRGVGSHWRYWEDADEKLHLQHESGGAWTDEAQHGDAVP